MVGDFYKDKWSDWPYNKPSPPNPSDYRQIFNPPPTIEEFNKLKKEVEEMKELLKRAKLYDELNNEPHCEMEDKVELLKRVAKLVGISLEDIFGKT